MSKSVCCPTCKENNPPTAKNCWLCREPLPKTTAVFVEGANGKKKNRANLVGGNFITIMIVMLLGLMSYGMMLVAPGWGIAIAVIFAPLLVSISNRDHREPVTTLSYLAVIVAVGIAGVVTYCGVCFASASIGGALSKSESGMYGGLAVGAWIAGPLAALLMVFFLLYKYWPRNPR